MEGWSEEAREAAQLVIDKHGDPDEVTASVLIWHNPGPSKRVITYRDLDAHNFPAPHRTRWNCSCKQEVPTEKVSDIVASTEASW